MYRFWGKVRKHNQRGRSLGFPTANVNIIQNIPEGIYISQTKIQGNLYPSLTFVGIAKTFDEGKFQTETYILDFKKNIYHKWISVKLIKLIRENKRFEDVDSLIVQMRKDEEKARKFFELNSLLTR